ncbi:MAG: hypothetical protein ACJARU_001950 [Congregibacter sp.]|jgi:hypothetical protein
MKRRRVFTGRLFFTIPGQELVVLAPLSSLRLGMQDNLEAFVTFHKH